jgi:hypothetical protein
MTKLLCVVLVSSLLLATLAGASSSSLMPSLGRHQAQVLGRKGRDLGQLGYHHQHQTKHMQQHEVSSYFIHPLEPVEVQSIILSTKKNSSVTEA